MRVELAESAASLVSMRVLEPRGGSPRIDWRGLLIRGSEVRILPGALKTVPLTLLEAEKRNPVGGTRMASGAAPS